MNVDLPTGVGEFARDDLGLLECPDIFEMTADDGSSRWVLGVSANANAASTKVSSRVTCTPRWRTPPSTGKWDRSIASFPWVSPRW